ncbi:ABC transporter ATP-binding protein [Picosynechococcus sp. PCC 7117]|uniref:ABC transporter ATP-binding protein n=1 Tax=Picosynechococcus sp. PCC 7117 TaxID=195498 RepID=UPI000810E594|nr:ABC transporter ATP-binding protein [Picosynechococcus sp. PCC 7117]ANV87496.1 ATP-binding protein [Picosynechococcus sp. PCC 7117]
MTVTLQPQAPLLVTENLTVGYQRRALLQDLNLAIAQGQFVCLVGANGSGKSTLIRTLAGLEAPQAGQVWLNGTPLTALNAAQRAQRLSLVLTERVDLAWMSVTELVALGRYPYTDWQGRLGPTDRQIVREAIAAVGLTNLQAQPLNNISDGERQKAMIARALAQATDLMLLDEPTAYLDVPRRVEVMQLLRFLAHQQGRTVLMSTHDLDLALRSADQLWLITPSQRLVVGTPEELALEGYLGTTFSSDRFYFDQMSGQFQLQYQRRSPIQFIGQGLAATWTERALTRLGFEAVQTPCPLRLDLQEQPTRWLLSQGDRQMQFMSLGALSAHLQALQWENC